MFISHEISNDCKYCGSHYLRWDLYTFVWIFPDHRLYMVSETLRKRDV